MHVHTLIYPDAHAPRYDETHGMCMHTRMQARERVRSHARTCTHTHARACTRMHAHTHMHAHTRTCTHMHAHARTRTHTHAHARTRTHMHAHARTRTRTCTHTHGHRYALLSIFEVWAGVGWTTIMYYVADSQGRGWEGLFIMVHVLGAWFLINLMVRAGMHDACACACACVCISWARGS